MVNILYKETFERENYLSPIEGYPERPVSWFKDTTLPNALDSYKGKENLLDVGCAFGYFTSLFAPYFNTVTGIDFAKNRIDFAQEAYKSIPNLCFYQSNIEVFNPTSKYDAMFTSMVIQHIPKDSKINAFKNLHNLATDNCIFLLYDFNFSNEEVGEDFVSPISPYWLKKYVSSYWTCISCEPFIKEPNPNGCLIYKYILQKVI